MLEHKFHDVLWKIPFINYIVYNFPLNFDNTFYFWTKFRIVPKQPENYKHTQISLNLTRNKKNIFLFVIILTQLQDGSRLTFSYIFFSSFTFSGSRITFSYISFSCFSFPGASYRIFLLFLPWLPCHFYLVVIEQQQQNNTTTLPTAPQEATFFLFASYKQTIFI